MLLQGDLDAFRFEFMTSLPDEIRDAIAHSDMKQINVSPRPFHKPRILCVDDDITCTATRAEIFREHGYSVVYLECAPGFREIDSSAFKDFHITERQVVNFRVDGFNVFNFASYGNPDNGVTDNNFGQITRTRSGPRTIEFAARDSF